MPPRHPRSAGEGFWFCLFLVCSGDEHSGSGEACGGVDWSILWCCHLRLLVVVDGCATPRNAGLALGKRVHLAGSLLFGISFTSREASDKAFIHHLQGVHSSGAFL